jgi:flagellar hook protein FlgE
MSMLGTIYIGLSGMTAYSKGLDTISNNVANLNTAGFKSSQPTFFDVLFRNGSGSIPGSGGAPTGGAGVGIDTARQSFQQGELRDTGNPLDVAIDGDGFFVLSRDGELLFTRAGQFEFDKDGVLVERSTRGKALVTTATEGATSFDLDGFRVFAPKATTEVTLTGTLARTGSATFDLSNIDVLDAGGGKQTLKAHFVRNDTEPLKWSVEFTDSDDNSLGKGGLEFEPDGTLAEGTEPLKIQVAPQDMTPFDVVIKMGTAGGFTGITSPSNANASQLSVSKRDGVELGTLVGTSFDDRGRITLTYTNGETLTPATLLLAQFTAPDQFRSLGSGLFAAFENQRPELAVAQSGGRGRVVGSKVEMSNVDLTQQFSDLIIIQRGFQASSQMTSAANEMLQQLLALTQKS